MAADSEIKDLIIALEEKLLKAFCDYDVNTLDELIHESALFILPSAQTISKSTVLDNYRQRKMTMEIVPSDPLVNLIGDTAVISVNLESHTTAGDIKSHAQFRYLRVWKRLNGTWKIIATGGVLIK